MNARVPEPVKIALVELQSKYLLLDFLVKQDVKSYLMRWKFLLRLAILLV